METLWSHVRAARDRVRRAVSQVSWATALQRVSRQARTAIWSLWPDGRRLSSAFLAVGGLLLLAAATYGLYSWLTTWLMGQNRYLVAGQVAALGVPTRTATPLPTLSPTPLPSATPLPTPTPTRTPTPMPTAVHYAAPVQVRIPAIGVSRSIIALPRVKDRSGAWTWNTKRLFRSGSSDLVGHWEGSAHPGEQGNMVLVGHNYGYGYNGVFVSLGRLRAGQRVTVIDKAGASHTYQVTLVKKLKWRQKDFAELTQHLDLLAPGGKERVTLVSCAGADIEPFPERVYVVAEPVR